MNSPFIASVLLGLIFPLLAQAHSQNANNCSPNDQACGLILQESDAQYSIWGSITGAVGSAYDAAKSLITGTKAVEKAAEATGDAARLANQAMVFLESAVEGRKAATIAAQAGDVVTANKYLAQVSEAEDLMSKALSAAKTKGVPIATEILEASANTARAKSLTSLISGLAPAAGAAQAATKAVATNTREIIEAVKDANKALDTIESAKVLKKADDSLAKAELAFIEAKNAFSKSIPFGNSYVSTGAMDSLLDALEKANKEASIARKLAFDSDNAIKGAYNAQEAIKDAELVFERSKTAIADALKMSSAALAEGDLIKASEYAEIASQETALASNIAFAAQRAVNDAGKQIVQSEQAVLAKYKTFEANADLLAKRAAEASKEAAQAVKLSEKGPIQKAALSLLKPGTTLDEIKGILKQQQGSMLREKPPYNIEWNSVLTQISEKFKKSDATRVPQFLEDLGLPKSASDLYYWAPK